MKLVPSGASPAGMRRVLVCTAFPPRLDARHGGKATAQLLLHLAARNEIGLLYLRQAQEPSADATIADRCVLVTEVPAPARGRLRRRLAWGVGLVTGLPPWAVDCRSSAFDSALAHLLDEWRPDVVEIHLQAMAQYVAAPARMGVARILVDHDPGSSWADELLRGTTGLRRLSRRLEVAAWRRYERRTRPRFDAIVVFADRDLAAVQASAGHTPVTRIPLAVDVPGRPLAPEGSGQPTILFVGGFGHPPNADAARWLAASIFPRVLQRVPEARLELVGNEPGDEVLALASNRVSVHGSVPNVTPYMDRAAVVVAPIRIGGGMRVKVLEALAAGKALVATRRAAEGLEAQPGEHLLVADDEDRIVEALVELLLDPQRRRRLAEGARRWAEARLGWDEGVAAFEELYESLAGSRRA
jgi:glycosyltransferase involved in cell wall biosynthesis